MTRCLSRTLGSATKLGVEVLEGLGLDSIKCDHGDEWVLTKVISPQG